MIFKSTLKSVKVADEPLHEVILEKIWDYHKRFGDKPCLISAEDESIKITYKQIFLNAYSVASFLKNNGFKKPDVATFVTFNSWEILPIFLGCSLRGITLSGMSYAFNEREIETQLIDSDSKIVFCSKEVLNKVLKVAKNCPKIRMIVLLNDLKKPTEELPFGTYKFSDVLAATPDLKDSHINIDPVKDILILPYSSGTTGTPKGVMLSNKNFGTMMNAVEHHFESTILPSLSKYIQSWEDESSLLFLPFYHIYGFGLLINNLLRGSTGIIMKHFDQNIFCSMIQKYKIKVLALVPPILVFLAKHSIPQKYDLTSLRFILTGAAPCGKDLIDEVRKKYPSIQHIYQGYGMTEVGMGSHFPFVDENSNTSAAGRLAPNYEMKIVDVETGKEQNIGEKGEIWLRGPTIMLGYYKKQHETDEMIDRNGWLRTGDIGFVDKHNNLFIVDRIKELIKVKGLQVAPAELEDILLSHPKVQDCAVIGIPDNDAGELPKAFVVKKDKTLNEKDVYDYVANKVAHYKHLKGGVEFIDEIPKSPAGKILRRFLREKVSLKNKI
ncbi:Acyl-CoA synthetase family member 2,mitochondrial [Strongyloides ratti]|uniref:Acyl-CoA synthetase family member 2,mitochondrial n=1 Tax=Strongyloides ratti TaxID=34506 RepID=A0A090KT39_STRRB|nr:Acyl-CoA synthetase family member 2,mitochondrial [Strongyloides ratti]CEF60576.1 Acyl-CoA synthetase family member 2,mitochondrial [Strongyloides ratti]